METIKVTIGEKTFWHRAVNDDLAVIMTADPVVKETLYKAHIAYPDTVETAYDEEDADFVHVNDDGSFFFGEDLEGMAMFFVKSRKFALTIMPGQAGVRASIYHGVSETEVTLRKGAQIRE